MVWGPGFRLTPKGEENDISCDAGNNNNNAGDPGNWKNAAPYSMGVQNSPWNEIGYSPCGWPAPGWPLA
jgi:hypothetical protein